MSDAQLNQFEEPPIEIGNAHVLLKPHEDGNDCLAVFARSIRASMVLSFIQAASLASSVISVPARAFDTGQPALAVSACPTKAA